MNYQKKSCPILVKKIAKRGQPLVSAEQPIEELSSHIQKKNRIILGNPAQIDFIFNISYGIGSLTFIGNFTLF